MADFNKIYTTSSLTVIPASFASLGFNDNKLISKNKYSINENILNLYEDTTDTFTVFSNNGIATTYEFNYIRLNTPGVILPEIDINQNLVSGLSQDRVLVFVDGELQAISNYTVVFDEKRNDTALKFNVNYTNDYNKLYNIIVYSSTSSFKRISYTKEDLENLVLKQQRARNGDESISLARNEFQLPVTYEYKNTMLFINGHKIPFNAIEFLNPGLNKINVKLNIPESLLDVERFDIVKFTDTSTNSINFTTSQGYLTYGPYDDYGRKIPNTYNVIFRFADQVKLLIDNVRQGFIIKEEDGYGEAIITDTTFESTEVKALMIQPFPKSSYLNTQYYLEVPEYTSIVNYLAEFDKKYTFLPEVLTIFQKLLLNDINDTIQRLRDVRSISKVDSIHINKLISLLGFNINIKSLNKKQRRELLEELNEFYRRAGTRSSYNLINILQNNLKLIRADQLFTPVGLQNQTLYKYTAIPDLENPGTGYSVGEVLVLKDTGLVATITEVDTNGGISAIELETSEGFENITGNYPLKSLLNGTFTVNSTPNLYRYNWETSDAVECSVGTLLWSGERRYGLRVTGMDGNTITSFDRYSTQGDPYQDSVKVDFKNLQLYRLLDNLSATITSTPIYSPNNDYGEPIYVNTVGGQEFELPVEAGAYYVEAAGAGGAGGAGDSRKGNEYDLPATNGSDGELRTATFVLTEAGVISGKVGQGGGKVKARGHDSQPYNTVKGKGFHNGELGELRHLSKTTTTAPFGSYRTNAPLNSYKATLHRGNVAGGQGGGSTGLRNIDGSTIIEARGGNGGSAGSGTEYVRGGTGAAGGIVTGSPLAGRGGARALGGDFWSKDGGDGWIKIYKIPVQYTVTVNGDTSGVADNDVYALVESDPAFTITAHRNENTVTFDLSPKTGLRGCNSTFDLKTDSDDATVKLTVNSEITLWNYDVKLTADTNYLKAGSTFINTNSPVEEQFTFVATQDNSTVGTWTPKTGVEQITLKNVPAYTQHGTNGRIYVFSEKTQKNEDRCYIDFYKKEEIGAEPIVEFRSHTISHGTITEGTPKSPYPWKVGEPDISYGTIIEGTPNSPDPSISGDPDISYGLVSESTEGEWVEYWKWDRSSNWYPTNHVDLEMKLPPGVNFSEYVNTFIEQFYNLASTVVFIHQITESFYFGSDSSGTGGNGTVITDDGLIGDAGVMTAPFGIVSTMPLMTYSATVTSDPDRQYVDPLGDTYNMTIIPLTTDATVTITREDVYSNGSIIKKVLAQGVGTQTAKVKYGNTITYTVSKADYITKSTTLVVDTDITKYVILESKTPAELKYCKFTITPTPINADITLTACGITTTKSNTIYAWSGNKINYTVSYPGYITHSGSIILNDDTDLYVVLKRYESDLIFTITPTPSDATVVLTAEGYVQEGNSISVKANTQVNYTVYKSGYDTISSSITIVQDLTLPVVLHHHESKNTNLGYISELVTDIYNNGTINEDVTEIQDLGKI